MHQLNFPDFQFRFKNSQNKVSIFDEIRKKFIQLTPEEWVRQNVIRFFIDVKKYPKSLINVEKILKINGLIKRYDVVIFHSDGSINILVECKSTAVKISQNTFDQIARYNMTLNANYLMVTNGLDHFYCKINIESSTYLFLEKIPDYNCI